MLIFILTFIEILEPDSEILRSLFMGIFKIVIYLNYWLIKEWNNFLTVVFTMKVKGTINL